MKLKNLSATILIIVLATCLTLGGCEGTESHEAATNTVEELAGKKKLNQMKQMKQDIDAINQQQADRLKEPDK